MATADEHNQDTDLDDEQNGGTDEGDDENEGDESEEGTQGGDSNEEDSGTTDDDDSKPITRKDLAPAIAKAVKQALSESRRLSGKKGPLAGKKPRADGGRPSGDDSQTDSRLSNLEVAERKRTFGYENSLAPAEVDYIFKINKNPTKEFLKEPFVQGGLEAMRRTANVKGNIPHGTGRSFSVKGKTFGDMTPEERAANFPAMQDAVLRGKGRRA